jgi:iron complex outermembrane receptor protein
MTGTARIEGKYQSLQYFDPFNYGATSSPGYAVLDASFGIVRDRWSLDLWGRNLTNRLYLVEAQEQYGFNSYEYGFGAPRTFGLRVSVWME